MSRVQKIMEAGQLQKLYSLEWFRNRAKSKKGPHQSSIHLAKLVKKLFKFKSCVDFGAGSLAFANEIGIRATAVEGSKFNAEFAKTCLFVHHNLCKSLNLSRKFDLVTCWDVIEHIPKKYEPVVVKTIVKHASDLVLLSISNSKWGKFHVNCEPKKYWVKVFEAAGLKYDKELTEKVSASIFNDKLITSKWYARNLMVFKKAS
jgi:2-polyprenyl-3-methyl-5-hydroxy-6-metoxy-1,4-benzoquinol methylase